MRRRNIPQLNTIEHWNHAHTTSNYPFPGLDMYLLLLTYYRPLLIQLGYPDLLPSRSTWLDFGCGQVAKRLPHLPLPDSVRYYGVDFSPAVISANQRIRPDLHWSTDLPTDRFDLVTAIHVLEHVDHPQETRDNLWALTTNALVIQVPYLNSFDDSASPTPQHLWEFDEWSFNSEVEPLVIVGPKLNLEDDREIIYVWYREGGPSERIVLRPFEDQLSPQAWYLWHVRLGFNDYYCPSSVRSYLTNLKQRAVGSIRSRFA